MPKLELNRSKRTAAKKVEEYYNSISTNIQLSGEFIKVITCTSVYPNEGKSTVALNLAMAFARVGYKTLLLDTDIRNSVISGTLKSREKVTGLTDYLSGLTDLSLGLCDTDVDNLFVIQAGQSSPNPTGLLQSKNFENMMGILRKYYDYIIVDTPPVGLVVDAAIVTQKCDASLLVAEIGRARRKEIEKAKEQLESTGIPFLGVVLNKFDTKTDKYGVYGQYGNYGKK